METKKKLLALALVFLSLVAWWSLHGDKFLYGYISNYFGRNSCSGSYMGLAKLHKALTLDSSKRQMYKSRLFECKNIRANAQKIIEQQAKNKSTNLVRQNDTSSSAPGARNNIELYFAPIEDQCESFKDQLDKHQFESKFKSLALEFVNSDCKDAKVAFMLAVWTAREFSAPVAIGLARRRPNYCELHESWLIRSYQINKVGFRDNLKSSTPELKCAYRKLLSSKEYPALRKILEEYIYDEKNFFLHSIESYGFQLASPSTWEGQLLFGKANLDDHYDNGYYNLVFSLSPFKSKTNGDIRLSIYIFDKGKYEKSDLLAMHIPATEFEQNEDGDFKLQENIKCKRWQLIPTDKQKVFFERSYYECPKKDFVYLLLVSRSLKVRKGSLPTSDEIADWRTQDRVMSRVLHSFKWM